MALGRRAVLGAALGIPVVGVAKATLPRLMPGALTMATGEPGGGFAVYGPAWGAAAQQEARIAVSYRVSGGSAANVLLIEQGQAQLGMTTLAIAGQGWTGGGRWTGGVKLQEFRALFPIFGTSLQIFAPARGAMRHLADLSDRRIGVGPAGSAGAILVGELLAATGIRPRVELTGLYAEQIALMRKGRIDACAFLGVTPLPDISAAADRDGFNLIGLTPAEAETMSSAVPGLRPTVISRHSLPALSAAVATIGSGAIAIGRADLPDALVAAVTDAALTRRKALLRALPATESAHVDWAAAGWIDDTSQVQIHPGAASVLRRHGLVVPASLVRG